MTTINKENGKGVGDEDLKEFLQCRICSKIPHPPIYQCGKGHIVCSRCRDKMGNCYKFVKVSNCTLCQEPPIVSRNVLLEELFQKSTFKCDYSDQGCGVSVLGPELKKHLAGCEYRPLSCHMGRKHNCNYSLVDYASYIIHLKLVHNFTTETADANGRFNLMHSLTLPAKSTDSPNWKNHCVSFDSKIFIPRISTSPMVSDMLKFHLAIFGNKSEAGKYTVKFYFQKNSKTDVPSYVFNLPVYPIRISDKDAGNMHQGIVNYATLRKIGDKDKSCGMEIIEFKVDYHISKIISK